MISFSSITDCPKTDYDDVSDWYITNTIIKDPPKGIHTRRIVKVGEDNGLLEAQDGSADRVSENIRQYSLGVNPMVSVAYNNASTGQQAYLPYRIMDKGAFRPPIQLQQDLMPLSRLPRDTTCMAAPATWVDWSKRIAPSEDAIKFKEVLNTVPISKVCAPRNVDIIAGTSQPYELKYAIEDKPQRMAFGNDKNNIRYFKGDHIEEEVEPLAKGSCLMDPVEPPLINGRWMDEGVIVEMEPFDAPNETRCEYKVGVKGNDRMGWVGRVVPGREALQWERQQAQASNNHLIEGFSGLSLPKQTPDYNYAYVNGSIQNHRINPDVTINKRSNYTSNGYQNHNHQLVHNLPTIGELNTIKSTRMDASSIQDISSTRAINLDARDRYEFTANGYLPRTLNNNNGPSKAIRSVVGPIKPP